MSTFSKSAFPWKPYTGEDDEEMDFDEYKADFLAYIITEDLVEHFDEPDPSTIARADQAYIVPADDQNDPHDPPGTNVPAETEVRYAIQD